MQTIQSLTRCALLGAAFAFSLQAQCLDTNTGVSVGSGDDVVLAGQSLGFSFPFAGSTYTTVHPCTNGFVYLGNGTADTDPNCCAGDPVYLTAALSPMIAPFWADLLIAPGTGTVRFSTTGAKAVVTWDNANEYYTSANFSFQLWLYPSGEMDFVYDTAVAIYNGHEFLVGMSPGGGATIPSASDFTISNLSTSDTNFQLFGPAVGPVPLAGTLLQFLPISPGFVWVPNACLAKHEVYGSGCYGIAGSFYQFTQTAADVTALSNSAYTLIKTPTGYTTLALGGYVAPTGSALDLGLGDDDETTVTLTSPFPYFGGSTSTLQVCSNGFVSVAAGNGSDYLADPAAMLDAPATAWWSWKDYDTGIAGAVKFEQIGSIAYITWDGVANFGGSAADPNYLQFQFDTTSGNVTIAYGQMSTNAPSTGSMHLVGYSSAGPGVDPGSIDLAMTVPFSLPGMELPPLSLVATPAPISTPTSGTVVTYTTSNMSELVPGSGVYVALNILSLNPLAAPGLDLAFIGAPGCSALVQSLDYTQAMVGLTNSLSVTLAIPPGITPGTIIYSQSVGLIAPNSLPNGQNAFGIETSNGIASTIDVQ